MSNEPNYYKILQVDPEAEAEVITAAYRRLAAKYHPDVNRSADAERRMREFNAAYEVLSDPSRRAAYDQTYFSTLGVTGGRGRRPRGSGTSPAPHRAATVTGARATPILIVSPAHIALGSISRGSSRTIDLQIGVTDGRTVIGEVRASHPWIRLSASQIFSDSTIVRVTIDTAGLDEGRAYSGSITVESIVYGTRNVPVSLRVVAPPRPTLRLVPNRLDFGVMTEGQSPKVVSFRVLNSGASLLRGTVRSSAPWLSVSLNQVNGNATVIEAIADISGLRPGLTYRGQVIVESNGGAGMIDSRVVVQRAGLPQEPVAEPGEPGDLEFLRERLRILNQQTDLTSAQTDERIIIYRLLDICQGGDVAERLGLAIAAAQSPELLAEAEEWKDEQGQVIPMPQVVSVLGDLLGRLQKWESQHAGMR